jgi:branched-chain amino acid transport system substrate-binding protein
MRGRTLRLAGAVLVAALVVALAMAVSGCTGGSGASSSSGAGASSSGAFAEPIKLGAIVSLTGSYAAIGTPQKSVIEMEAKALNDAGGINGRKVEVIFEDDATDPTKAVAAATKLIDQDKVVGMIGSSGTGASMAIRSLIDRAGIPNVSMAGGNDVTGKLDKLVYSTAWNNALVAPFELAYMQKHGIKKIGLISDSGAFGKDGVATLTGLVGKYGISIVSQQTFNPGDTDMSAQLTNIKKTSPDAIVMWTAGAEAATVIKNAKSLGITVPIYGSHGNARGAFAEAVGTAGDGFLFGAGHLLAPDTYTDPAEKAVATKFISDFEAANNNTPPSTFAGHAYDAFQIMANAAKSIKGDVTGASLADAVQKTTNYQGVCGVFTFTPTDHLGLSEKDLTMYQLKGGKFEVAPQ